MASILKNILILLIIIFTALPVTPMNRGKNILLITLDTTRADHIGCFNPSIKATPHIDSMGNEGVIFANCRANVPVTLPAHASILTGKHPFVINVRNNGWYALDNKYTTITEILKREGFSTFAVISSYVLASKFGLAQGFDFYDDSLDVNEANTNQSSQITAQKVFNKFKFLLEKNGNKKFFAWVHFYDPHHPYSPPGEFGKKFTLDPYLGEIAYTDHYVGRIKNLLQRRGVLKDTTIIIVGDHGEDKGEHREFGHGIFCYDVTLKVPLIIWNGSELPGRKRVSNRVKLTDIFQAIIHLTGSSPGKAQPSSLLALARGKQLPERDLYFESLYAEEHMGWSPMTGIISNGHKYISLPVPELYDLNRDPEEKNNIFKEKKSVAIELDRKIAKFYSSTSETQKSGRRKLSKKDRDHLASLGYISSFKKSSKRIDPKKGMQYLDRLRAVRNDIEEGHLEKAERDMKKIFFSKERIDSIHAYEIFDALYRKKGDEKSLLKFRELAVKDFPESFEFTDLLAKTYFALGRFDDAEKVCRNTLKKNKNNTQAILMLGKIRTNQGEPESALSFFRRAEKLEPMNYGIKRNIARILRSTGKREAAVKLLEQITGDTRFRNNPDNIGLLTQIALQMFNTGAGEKGLSLLRQLIPLHQNRAEPLITTGTILSKMKRDEEALEYFSTALEKDRNNSHAFSKTGVSQLMLFMKKRDPQLLDKAVKNFSTAISLNSGLAEAWSGRGTAYIFQKRSQEAVKDLERALTLNPGLVDVYFNLGIMYLRSGNKEKAHRLFLQCREKFSRTLRPAQLKRLDNLLRESK